MKCELEKASNQEEFKKIVTYVFKSIRNPGFSVNDLFCFDNKKPGMSLVSEMIRENNFEVHSKREHKTP